MHPWRPVRAGLQLIFFAWLVNACWGVLHGLVFNTMIESARDGGSPATWKILDRVSLAAGFADLAAMTVAAMGMLLVARAPAQAGAGGLATGGFGCLLGSIALSFMSFVEQFLEATQVINDPLLPWRTARYVYAVESLSFLIAMVLFLIAMLKIATALRASDAAWQGIVALIAIPLVTFTTMLPLWLPSIARYRFDHRWIWFVATRGIRGIGDVMFLLFLAHLSRVLARPAPAAPARP